MNAQPAILSIAVLASFALAIGGGWFVARRRDRKRGALMIAMALILLVNVLLWALPVPVPVPAHAASASLGSGRAAASIFPDRCDPCDYRRGQDG